MHLHKYFAVLLVLAASACASLPPPLPGSAVVGQRNLTGRISVQYKDESDRQEAFHGRFDWLQTDERIEVSVLDPLGQSVALLSTDAAGQTSELTLRNGEKISGTIPEDLTERVLGWRLPVSGLRYWLDGKPAPGSGATLEVDTDAAQGAARLLQDGWTIRYPAQALDAAPKRIDLSYSGQGRQVELRLVIDRRDPAPAPAAFKSLRAVPAP